MLIEFDTLYDCFELTHCGGYTIVTLHDKIDNDWSWQVKKGTFSSNDAMRTAACEPLGNWSQWTGHLSREAAFESALTFLREVGLRLKIVKALKTLNMARSGSEANRMVKDGSVLVGGCIPPCNARVAPYKCTCDGWRKVTDPTEDIPAGTVLRVKDGSWRLLVREGTASSSSGVVYDQISGIGWVPDEQG